MRTQTKVALGSVFATFGALALVLSLLFEWFATPSPWNFLLAFVFGVITGLGATLVLFGLIDRKTGDRIWQRKES